jgi:hypothetical protein
MMAISIAVMMLGLCEASGALSGALPASRQSDKIEGMDACFLKVEKLDILKDCNLGLQQEWFDGAFKDQTCQQRARYYRSQVYHQCLKKLNDPVYGYDFMAIKSVRADAYEIVQDAPIGTLPAPRESYKREGMDACFLKVEKLDILKDCKMGLQEWFDGAFEHMTCKQRARWYRSQVYHQCLKKLNDPVYGYDFMAIKSVRADAYEIVEGYTEGVRTQPDSYTEGGTQPDSCPVDSQVVASLDECQEAGIALGFEWYKTGDKSGVCTVIRGRPNKPSIDNQLYFGPIGATSKNTQAHHFIICKYGQRRMTATSKDDSQVEELRAPTLELPAPML